MSEEIFEEETSFSTTLPKNLPEMSEEIFGEDTLTSLDSYRPTLENEPLLERQSTSSSHPPRLRDYTISYMYLDEPVFTCAVFRIWFAALFACIAYYGIVANLVPFAKSEDQLSFTELQAWMLFFAFHGTCFLLILLVGLLVDTVAVLDKFLVISFSAIPFTIGAVLLPAAAGVEDITFKTTLYITGLFFVAFGFGGMMANMCLFGTDQVAYHSLEAIQSFVMWYYWFFNLGQLIAFTFVAYAQQEDLSKNIFVQQIGYLIPVVSMIIFIIIFLGGKRSYIIRRTLGSDISAALKIIKEAIKKSRRSFIASSFIFHWLDRAKTILGGSYSDWEIEDVKKVFRLLPIFTTFIMWFAIHDQIFTSMSYQGQYMDINLSSSFKIPVASFPSLHVMAILVFIPVMDKLVYPLLSKYNRNPSQLQRMGIGMITATMSMVCAGVLEMYRTSGDQCCVLHERGPNYTLTNVSRISIFYQTPQYALIGLGEVFTVITGLDFVYSQAPKCFHGVVMATFFLTFGLGALVGAGLLAVVNVITGISGNDMKWFPEVDYINQGKLANYFFLLAVLMALNFMMYIYVAVSYKSKKDASRRNFYPTYQSTSDMRRRSSSSSSWKTPPTPLINYYH